MKKAKPIVIKEKCSTKKRKLCAAMDKFAADQYGSGRRIFRTQTMNMKTGKEGFRVAYQYGSKQKEFVWMNTCPWCQGTL